MTHSTGLNSPASSTTSKSFGARQFVLAQGLVAIALFLLLLIFGSTPLAVSALWSGCTVFFGNLTFLGVMSSGFFGSSVVSVLFGQFLKLVVVLVLLGLAVWSYDQLVWSGFLLGLVVALLFVFVAPFIVNRAEKNRDSARVDMLLKVLNNKK